MALRAALAAWLLCALCPAPGSAQHAPAQLVLIEPVPEGAQARIAGQTADLDWRLSRAPGPNAPSDVRDPVERALAVAAERDARAALWIEESADAFTLRLLDPEQRRLLERRFELDPRAGPLARSAALEALALAVRSALRALAADEPLGEAVGKPESGRGAAGTGASAESATGAGAGTTNTGQGQAATDAQAQAARAEAERQQRKAEDERADEDEGEGEDEDDEDSEPEPDEPAGGQRSALALVLALGWYAAVDGHSPVGQQGPWARAGVALGRLELGAQGQIALRAKLSDNETKVGLARQAALGYAAVELLQRSPLRLGVALTLGVCSFRRETLWVAEGLHPTDDTSKLAFAAGLELRAALLLFAGLSLEISAGALTVPAAPVLRYDGGEYALWVIEPELRIGPHLRFPL